MVDTDEKYLGLPTVFDKSKKFLFAALKDSVEKPSGLENLFLS